MQKIDISGCYKEAGKQWMIKGEGYIQKLLSLFSSEIMTNSFTLSTEEVLPLINIGTGT